MKSSWFKDRKRYEFAKCLQSADERRHGWDLYRDWAQCASLALRQAVHVATWGRQDAELEEKYMKTIAGVREPSAFSECMGILTEALEESPGDFLGAMLGEWESLNSNLGQFFTPDDLCRLMNDLTMDAQPDPNHRMTIQEPAAGAGAMLIHCCQTLKSRGFMPWNYYCVAMELDARMFQTCFIQLSLLGVPATVYNMNTLTLEEFDRATTLVGVLHPWREPREERLPDSAPAPEPTANEATKGMGEQLSLF